MTICRKDGCRRYQADASLERCIGVNNAVMPLKGAERYGVQESMEDNDDDDDAPSKKEGGSD